jgi:hypothetical protein
MTSPLLARILHEVSGLALSLRENTQKNKFWQEKDDLLWLAAEKVIIFFN